MIRRGLTVLALASVVAACAESAPKEPAKPALPPTTSPQFDGVYAAPVRGVDGSDLGWDYLRFLPDGTVLSVSSPAPVEQAAALLYADDDRTAKGTVEMRGGRLRFVLKSKLGAVAYEGVARATGLFVHWRSLINGASLDESFTFVPVVEDTAPDTQQSTGKPDVGLLPAGSGWFCYHVMGGNVSRCERSAADCESSRKQAGTSPPPTRCRRQKRAYCHTVSVKATGEGTALCYPTPEDCDEGLGSFRSAANAADFTLSACDEE